MIVTGRVSPELLSVNIFCILQMIFAKCGDLGHLVRPVIIVWKQEQNWTEDRACLSHNVTRLALCAILVKSKERREGVQVV